MLSNLQLILPPPVSTISTSAVDSEAPPERLLRESQQLQKYTTTLVLAYTPQWLLFRLYQGIAMKHNTQIRGWRSLLSSPGLYNSLIKLLIPFKLRLGQLCI